MVSWQLNVMEQTELILAISMFFIIVIIYCFSVQQNSLQTVSACILIIANYTHVNALYVINYSYLCSYVDTHIIMCKCSIHLYC